MIYKVYYCKNCRENTKCEQRVNRHIIPKLLWILLIFIIFPFIGWFAIGFLLWLVFDNSPDKKDIKYYCCKCGNKV